MGAPEVRVLDRLADIPASDWDALHDGSNPFVRHAFLEGLESCGCLRPDWGWQPRHLTVWHDGQLAAAVPGYRKDNSHGEFVFDHSWAHAYAGAGLDYYPKWLGAVPYTPVTGPRLLARDQACKRQLLQAIVAHVQAWGLSSAHVNFPDDQDVAQFDGTWLARDDIQFHWRNPGNWHDFADFLAAMDHKHRKNIRQARRRIAETGLAFRVVDGHQASDDDLRAMHGFYLRTFADYGNAPALTLNFLHHLRARMPEALVMFFADHGAEPVAGALCLRGHDTLYGRYWGARRAIDGLHFELCYHQGIEYCLAQGLSRFEPGAQGEHKLARGFLPALVHSRHWIADAQARQALDAWCTAQRAAVRRHARALQAHSPFRTDAGVPR